MWLIDRYIAQRFLSNFIILLLLLFVFAISVDLILQLDEFVEVAMERVGEDAGLARTLFVLGGIVLDFHGPRLFQFYAYMVGLVSVGAMGFTLAQMQRHRELSALLAAGVRLQRLALPIIVVVFGLNLIQLFNQEVMLPQLAPRLIRTHSALGRASVDAFEVMFTADSQGNLFQAVSFEPHTATLNDPTILERDELGRTLRRITASSATWDDGAALWRLSEGRAIIPHSDTEAQTSLVGQEIETYETDLSPQVLTMRRYRQFATMLSVSQTRELIRTPGVVDTDALKRFLYARFSTILINMLVLVMTLPYFLMREPANMLRNSVMCAATAMPAMLGALIGATMALPGIPPAVSVFLPALVLIPVTMFMVTLIKS